LITTLGWLAAIVAVPIVVRVTFVLVGPFFAGAALGHAARDLGRRAERPPDRVHLSSRGPEVWRHPDQAGALVTPLLENGFEDAGSFGVNEMPGVFLRLMTDARNGILAVVYEHPRAAHWLELITRYPDGSSATFTTLRPSGLAPRPGHLIAYAPGHDAGALLARSLKERPAQPPTAVSRAKAVQLFEAGYSDAVAWRKDRVASAPDVTGVAQHRTA